MADGKKDFTVELASYSLLSYPKFSQGNWITLPARFIQLEGTQAWEFLGLRILILYFFIVSSAYILRLCKNFWIGPLLGEIGLFCVYGDYAEQRIFSKLDNLFFYFLNQIWPFIFANNSFSRIRSIKSTRDGFISQNVSKCKIYLAYTEYKRNRL